MPHYFFKMQTKPSLSFFEGDETKVAELFVDFSLLPNKTELKEVTKNTTKLNQQNRLLILLIYQTILNQREVKPLK